VVDIFRVFERMGYRTFFVSWLFNRFAWRNVKCLHSEAQNEIKTVIIKG